MPPSSKNFSSTKTTALVAGGAGFLGSYLCESLLALDCQVVCLDNFSTGKKENINHLLEKKDFFLFEADINEDKLWHFKASFPKANYIFHLASVEEYLSRGDVSLETLRTNSQGLENLLKLCLEQKAKFLFCSSMEVFTGSIFQGSLNGEVSNKTWDNQNFHEAKRFAEVLVADYFRKLKIDARVVRLGQVFGPRMSLLSGDIICSFFQQAMTGGPLKIPAEGNEKVSPVFVVDAVAGISRAMLAPGTMGKIYDINGSKETNLLSFAQEIKKSYFTITGRETGLEFVAPSYLKKLKTEERKTPVLPSGWEANYSFEEGIQETLKWCLTEQGRTPVVQKKKEEVVSTEENLPSTALVREKTPPNIFKKTFFLSLILLMVMSLLFFVINVFTVVRGVDRVEKYVKETDLVNLKKESQSILKAINNLEETILTLGNFVSPLGLKQKVVKGEKTLLLGKTLTQSLVQLVVVGESSEELADFIFSRKGKSLEEMILTLKRENENAIEKISLSQILLDQFTGEEEIVGSKLLKIKPVLPQIKKILLSSREMIDLIPEIIGIKEKRTYLILFQNNMEIRPGGGFIGSFGLLSLEEGRFVGMEVYDVYTADGQLRGHVEPPKKLKEFLGLSGWYLRDSNWSPDFPTNAARAEWFLEKEIGRTVDGVIGINLFVAQRILQAVGEIEIPDYKEKINADNFFEKATYHIEAGFFPGSSKKSDFLGSVSRILLNKLENADQKTRARVLSALIESLEQKDIVMSLHRVKAANLLAKNNWDGAVKNASCQKRENNCFQDYLMVNEANVGVNKANYFLKRSLEQKISIGDGGLVEEKLTISYENKSPENVFPAGDYKTYLRLLVPIGSRPQECYIINPDFERQAEECVLEELLEQERKVFAFSVVVPVKEKRKVEIVYKLSEERRFQGGEYLLFVQKQPGAFNDSYQLTISYPQRLSIIWANQSVLTEGATIVYNTDLSKDLPLEIGFNQ